MDCAQMHKIIGQKLENVQSVSSDSAMWSLEQIQALGAAGNERVNGLYECYMPSYYVRPQDLEGNTMVKESFTRAKYIDKLFLHVRTEEPEDEAEQRKTNREYPFLSMPQPIFEEEVTYFPEKVKKAKKYSLIVQNSYMNFYKKGKPEKKFAIDLANSKITMKKVVVKGLQGITVVVKDSEGIVHNISLANKGEIDFVHILRRASVYYAKEENKMVEKNVSATTYNASILEKVNIKGFAKINGNKKFLILEETEMTFFRSNKNLKVEGSIPLREAIFKIQEDKKNLCLIKTSFGMFKIKFSATKELEMWTKHIQQAIDKLISHVVADFKQEYVYKRN